MITKFNQLDLTKKYTYADYYTWKFIERVELFNGLVFKMNQTTSSVHQKISNNLSLEFGMYLRKKSYSIYVAPFDVRLHNKKKSTADKQITTVVQPDISIICNESKIDERGCLGSPDLIIEIISKAIQKKNLKQNLNYTKKME